MHDPSGDHGLLGHLLIWITAFFSWATGEAGRIIVAGAAGGLLRWLMQSGRKLVDGVIQVGAGALCAHYLNSFVAGILSIPFGAVTDKSMSGFIAGLLGISLAKIIIAVVEARSRKLGEPDDGAP